MKTQNKNNFLFFTLLLISIFSFFSPAKAATYTVTTTADSGAGSLRAAVVLSNASTTDDLINFAISATDSGCTNGVCTITLTSGEMVINRNYGLTVAGTGAGSLILSGNNASRIFNITGNGASAVFTLDGVTVTKSKSTYGGAIYDATYSTLITNSIFTNNTATGGSGGGAVLCNSPRCTITNSTFAGNTAPSGNGGAVVGASVANSIFTGNSAAYGGAIYEPQVTSSGFTISNSTFSSNSAAYAGAVYFDAGGSNYVNSTTFSGNTATTYGGAVYEYYCSVYFSNATISGNSTTNGSGGAFYDRLGNFYFTNSTVSGNYAKSSGGGIYAYTANVYKVGMFNTIISGNTSTTTAKDFYGTMDTANNNIIGDGTGATVTAGSGNQVGTSAAPVDAKLAPLAYNGGFGLTRALFVNSPAIDAGTTVGNSYNVIPALDQRGAARIGATDIGAFEFNNTNFTAVLPNGYQTLFYNSQIVPDSGSFNYSVTTGNLPPGLIVSATPGNGGAVSIAGTPTLAGTYTFTITGSDGANSTITNHSVTILSPTAAAATVGGRVLDFKGRGISNARLELTSSSGAIRTTISDSSGYYFFEDVEVGQTYIVKVKQKGYSFSMPSRVFSLIDELTDLNFTASPDRGRFY